MRVDHYVGYPVEALVVPHQGAKAEWTYGLMLEGGTVIRFYKAEIPKESEVAGKGKFIMAVTNYADGGIQVILGKPSEIPTEMPKEVFRIKSDQGSYSVLKHDDPEVEWFPIQAVDAERMELPDDPSGDRAVEAPEPSEAQDGSEPISAGEEAQNG